MNSNVCLTIVTVVFILACALTLESILSTNSKERIKMCELGYVQVQDNSSAYTYHWEKSSKK